MRLKTIALMLCLASVGFGQTTKKVVHSDWMKAGAVYGYPDSTNMPAGPMRDSIHQLGDTVISAMNRITQLGSVSVLEFGATGEGVVNDSLAFADAIATMASGGTLVVPAGTYSTGQINITKPMTIIGAKGAIIKLRDGVAGNLIRIVGVSDVTISGVTFDWNDSNQTEHDEFWDGIFLIQGTRNVTIEKCVLMNSTTGVGAMGPDTNLVVSGNTITHVSGGSIKAYGQLDPKFTFNHCDNLGFIHLGSTNATNSISLFNTIGGTISNNYIRFNKDTVDATQIAGIGVSSQSSMSREIRVTNNEIHGSWHPYGFGFTLHNDTQIQSLIVSGNTIDSTRVIAGLELNGSNCTVIGNTFRDMQSPAIAMYGDVTSLHVNNSIIGNTIKRCDGGIGGNGQLRGIVILGNTMEDGGTTIGHHAINLSGDSMAYITVAHNVIRRQSGTALSLLGNGKNVSISYNIIDSCGSGVNQYMGAEARDWRFSHNTITRKTGYAIDNINPSSILMFNEGINPSLTTTNEIVIDTNLVWLKNLNIRADSLIVDYLTVNSVPPVLPANYRGSAKIKTVVPLTTVVDGDGVDDFLLSDGGQLATNFANGTIETWLYLNTTPTTTNRIIFSRRGHDAAGASDSMASIFTVMPSRRLIGSHQGYNTTATIDTGVISTTVLDTLTWYHVAWSWDGANQKIYINGILDATNTNADTGTSIPETGSRATVLGASVSSLCLDGRMADFRIWRKAREGTDILGDYLTHLTGTETGLQAYFRFDDTTHNATHVNIREQKTDGLDLYQEIGSLVPVFSREAVGLFEGEISAEYLSRTVAVDSIYATAYGNLPAAASIDSANFRKKSELSVTSGKADSTINLSGGTAGAIPFQSGVSATTFSGTDLKWDNSAKRLMVSNGSILSFGNGAPTGQYSLQWVVTGPRYPLRISLDNDPSPSSQRFLEVGTYDDNYTTGVWTAAFSVNGYTGSIISLGQLKTAMLSAALTDGTPTDAEIDSATGSTPAAKGAGWEVWIKDTDGTSLMYRVVSDGTSWWTDPMTVAP